MMFYHVLVETNEKDKNGRNRQYHELDIQDKNKLLEKFVIPYLKEQPLRIDGYVLKDICRFVVTQSDLETTSIYNIRQDEWLRDTSILAIQRYSRKEVSRDKKYTKDITDELLEEAQNSLDTVVSELKKEIPIYSNHKVFIVHGRDTLLRTQVENVLRALGLEPIILQEQANIGKTIIEKIEECTDVGFGIVLYTPCDEGRLKSEDGELKPRARQNVVLEHGYLMAKLGRERVCCLVSKNVEFPSDIQGLGYIPANDFDQWKYKIAKELKAAGFDIDMNKL
ncbi:nucleotide-binding protein [Neisseria subflava]|uniref:TIR domain-containing protein n=1 Tax=Neisseria subflava TaxID=28449 RepID=UPI0020B6E52B|nr:nucleotide-binding protein [Neisseria subflava]UTG67810.1 nucleotide-binding protein [Neisseria subflava]